MGTTEPGAQDPKPTGNQAPPPGEEGTKGQQTSGNPPPDDESGAKPDEAKWDEGTKKYIASLRKESAAHRTKAKDLEGKFGSLNDRYSQLEGGMKKALGIEGQDELPPEERVKHLTQAVEGSTLKIAVLENAIANGLNHEQAEYYEFLMSRELSNLGDGEELTDESHEQIIGKVKGFGGGKAAAASTSVTPKGSTPPPDGKGETSADQFSKMTTTEKGELYRKNPDLYNRVFQEAKAKKLL